MVPRLMAPLRRCRLGLQRAAMPAGESGWLSSGARSVRGSGCNSNSRGRANGGCRQRMTCCLGGRPTVTKGWK